MSREFLTSDELAFLAKKNKELNLNDMMTAERQQELQHHMFQAVENWAKPLVSKTEEERMLKEWKLLGSKKEQGTDLITKVPNREIIAFEFELKNNKGKHLLLVDVNSLRNLVIQDGEMDVKSTVVMNRSQQTVIALMTDIMNQFATSTNLEMGFVFKKASVWDKKSELEFFGIEQLCQMDTYELTMVDESIVKAWHLVDLDYLDFVYRNILPSEDEGMGSHVTQSSQMSDTQETSELPLESKTVKLQQNEASASYVVNAHNPNQGVVKPLFQSFEEQRGQSYSHDIDLLNDIPLEVSVVLGKTKKTVKDILQLNTGKVIELDKYADDPVEVYANGKLVAEGEVVVVDENFGVKITRLFKNNMNAQIK